MCQYRAISAIFSNTSLAMLLIFGALLGYRRLRDVQYLQNDSLALRVLVVQRIPTASSISRQFSLIDDRNVKLLQQLQQRLVLDALERE